MKYLLSLAVIVFMAGCSDTFINHSLKAEKIGPCSNEAVPVKVISNINGERFEFQYCLAEGFDGKNYTVERAGDSLLVKFPGEGNKNTLYKITLDIDAKPRYNSITLGDGGQTIAMKAAERL